MGDANARQVLIHLRLPFSVFLLPVFVFAWAHSTPAEGLVAPLFLILHLLVYPSSNGFNSFMDRDTGSIGGIEHPKPVPPVMRPLTIVMDALATALTWAFYGPQVAACLVAYIVASRAYSARAIRLKRFPVIGYLLVVVFQGAWVFGMTSLALSSSFQLDASTVWGLAASLAMIGASYPLTQVYQHDQDLRDGVRTLSYALGIRGTFAFAAAMFSVFLACMIAYLAEAAQGWMAWGALVAIPSPAAWVLGRWAAKAWFDPTEANFRNTMRMSAVGSACMNLLFGTLLAINLLA